MITDLISSVAEAERRIDDQIMKLQDYQVQIDSVTQRVDAALGGSYSQYSQNMIDQLARTKEQVAQTITHLQSAKECLLRVRMV